MAHVYRAFFAPMMRMSAPSGMPTKVPFLFANIVKRLLKDYRPEYLAIVFDPPGATFRDKLFEKYKAQRQPMPDEMKQQLPYVRRLCEAMRMPVVEVQGYEADDVIGTLAVKGAAGGLEVLIVSNDKDMMQLVGDGIKALRTGSGGAKADVIVDSEKVKEILGVPPERVVDLMSLMGDTVDNIPGAKGIGEKGAAELIQKYGLVENALDHADEVSNKRYREALQQQRQQVTMSKQLAKISTDVPIELTLEALKIQAPDPTALAQLYRELGFTSLLKELGDLVLPAPAKEETEPAKKRDYQEFANVGEFRNWLKKLPAEKTLSMWLHLDAAGRESEGFGTKVKGIELSSESGEGRLIWLDEKEEALEALQPALADAKRPKLVHDPKVFQLMAGEVKNIQHATQFYSYLLRPT
ncbi:MAG TPA: 5'-3' exonuclease H3TH domain-containing protein, partial [Candidatus Acidoferrum sp.]|nr:5'-3' exonuclease H3TH domain-containing protein [Candidatus Acidoferrum sp.]